MPQREESSRNMSRQDNAKIVANQIFWPFVDKEEDCWTFNKNLWGEVGNKRGFVRWWKKDGKRKYVKASRFSFLLHNGDFDKKLYVLHRCDNILCVNPKHLFLGTQKDNMQDMIAKGRQSNGENHCFSKLTWEQVRTIRKLYATGRTTHRVLAKRYKVSHSVIRNIIIGVKWKESNDPNNAIHIENGSANISDV
jgi:DNA-directed RNA polymerase subunit L